MERSFLFVDSTNVDSATRKSIRRHVMNGKNVGKTHHRSSRFDIVRRTPYNNTHGTLERSPRASNEKAVQKFPSPVTNQKILGSSLLSLSFPLELTPHSVKVINEHFNYVVDKLYPCQLGVSTDESKYTWLRILLTDEAAFYCTIAALEATNEFFFGGSASSTNALQHLSRSLTLLKRRLESENAMSDSTLAIIIMVIVHEQLRNGLRESEIHYEGLKTLIELRGGLGQFEKYPILVLQIFKIDITYALQRGRPMTYYRDQMPEALTRLADGGCGFDWNSTASSVHHSGLSPYLHQIFLDVTRLAALFNHMPTNRSLDIRTFQELLVSIFSRLIRFQSLHDYSQLSNIEVVHHMGLTIFMMTLLFQYRLGRIVQFGHVSMRLQTVLDRNIIELDDNLVLWFLFLGGIWTRCSPDGLLLIPRIRTLTQRLRINTWIEAHNRVTIFPWINALHNEPSCAVWNSLYET